MRKFIMGLATVALIGAVGCGDNGADNNGTTNGDTNNVTNNEPNNEPNNETNNEPNNEPNNETNNATNNATNNSTNNATNNATNNPTNNATNNPTNNATNNPTNNATNNPTNNATPSAKCTQYCDIVEANCTDNNENYTGDPLYADRAECETACEGFSEDDTLDCTDPADCSAATEGVECRIYHGGVLGEGAPDDHCPHASEDGDGTCG